MNLKKIIKIVLVVLGMVLALVSFGMPNQVALLTALTGAVVLSLVAHLITYHPKVGNSVVEVQRSDMRQTVPQQQYVQQAPQAQSQEEEEQEQQEEEQQDEEVEEIQQPQQPSEEEKVRMYLKKLEVLKQAAEARLPQNKPKPRPRKLKKGVRKVLKKKPIVRPQESPQEESLEDFSEKLKSMRGM